MKAKRIVKAQVQPQVQPVVSQSLINRILQLGFYPVAAACIGEGAQFVNGGWYMPLWGCDTLQYIIDEFSG